MPIIGSFGAGSAGGFGQRKGGKPYFVRYLVIAGGGGGGGDQGGGAGAGGYREIACKTLEVVSGKGYTVSVGAGGIGTTAPACTINTSLSNGNPSIFNGIESTGGGAGGWGEPCKGPLNPLPFIKKAQDGGSGGGVGRYQNPHAPYGPQPADVLDGGAGNTPPFSPSQGNNGGVNPPSVASTQAQNQVGAGGGGAGAVGTNGSPSGGGPGGAGAVSNITGSCVTRAGGGGGGGFNWPPGYPYPSGAGGAGGGGNAGNYGVTYPTTTAGQPGTVNTGGGGGAGAGGGLTTGGTGGSGVVIIRRTTACSSGASGGCESTCGADTIHVFNSPGTFRA